MKKLIYILLIAMLFIGCSSKINVTIINNTGDTVEVYGDASGTMNPNTNQTFKIKSGGCLGFTWDSTTEHQCFFSDGTYTLQ
jgi:hypothetical protein